MGPTESLLIKLSTQTYSLDRHVGLVHGCSLHGSSECKLVTAPTPHQAWRNCRAQNKINRATLFNILSSISLSRVLPDYGIP